LSLLIYLTMLLNCINLEDRMVGWLRMMNWKQCGGKQPWPISTYQPSICLDK
jgi:hypothetical protein